MVNKRDLYSAFSKGIEEQRNIMGLSQKDMANQLDMSLSSYKSLIRGDNVNISMYTLFLACHITGLLASQLTGIPMDEAVLLSHYRSLPDFKRNALNDMLTLEKALSDSVNSQTGAIHNSRIVPCYELLGNMEDGMLFDSANHFPFDASRYTKICPESIDCAIKVTSNHLHPVYHLDDILLVHKAAPRDGDTGIFIHKPTRRIYIRRFRQTSPCKLIPINDMGEDITVNSYDLKEMNQWIKFGRIIMHI